MNSPFLHNFT